MRTSRLALACSWILVCSMACILLPVAQAEDSAGWPQFLGPNRNGISSETGLLDKYPADGPKVVWRFESGDGMSGIALDGKRAVTMIQKDGKQSVVALNPKTGDLLWSTEVASAYRNSMGDGPRATPTLTPDRVLSLTGEGILTAQDIESGKILWQHNLPKVLSGSPAEYGMASSPLVVGDTVIVDAGAPGAAVVGYRIKSGLLAWKAGSDAAGYSSPALLNVGGKQQVVAFTGGAAWGIDPQSGTQLWKYPFQTNFECNVATPIAVDGHVFLSSGENHGSVMLKLTPQGDKYDVSEVWSSFGPRSVMRNEWQTSILHDGYLYGMDNVGGAGPITHLKCINAATGKPAWEELRYGKGNLIFAEGKLYLVTMKGELIIARATPDKYDELSRVKAFESTRQAPALLDGKLYVRDVQEVICFDIAK